MALAGRQHRQRHRPARVLHERRGAATRSAGQRGWNRQPRGIRVGSGTSPSSTTGSSRSISGTTDSSACVYGCCGAASTSSVGPASTIRPRYITAVRSAMFQARPRSWVTTRTPRPELGAQLEQQREDLAADRGVQAGDRLVGDQQVRLRARAPRRSAPAAAARRTARAGSAGTAAPAAAARRRTARRRPAAPPSGRPARGATARAAAAPRRPTRRRCAAGSALRTGPGARSAPGGGTPCRSRVR